MNCLRDQLSSLSLMIMMKTERRLSLSYGNNMKSHRVSREVPELQVVGQRTREIVGRNVDSLQNTKHRGGFQGPENAADNNGLHNYLSSCILPYRQCVLATYTTRLADRISGENDIW